MSLLTITVTLDESRTSEAQVDLVLRREQDSNSVIIESKLTDDDGAASFEYDSTEFSPEEAIVARSGCWTTFIEKPSGNVDVCLEPYPTTGPLGWWHYALGIEHLDPKIGQGIKIGVVDTGVAPHESLARVKNLGSFKGVIYDSASGEDIEEHGTHVCGIIAARPPSKEQFWGIAPGAEVVAIRTALRCNRSLIRFQDSVACAISHLVNEEKVDLINLSLGAEDRSKILETHIRRAFDKGVVCICAAGNSAKRLVCFPAGYDESVAVAAVGKKDVGGPQFDLNWPREPEKFGQNGFFLARFSNYGQGLTCCAPGVRIISTVPDHGCEYSDESGTSMASPAACAALAVLLSKDKIYCRMERGKERAMYALDQLKRNCRDIGLSPSFQGFGLIQATRVPSEGFQFDG